VRTDEEVIERARTAPNGTKFLTLWAGVTSQYCGNDSDADLALLAILSFWTQDPAQLDHLFRRSGLMREKWECADYGERTVARALDRGEVWTPSYDESIFTRPSSVGSVGASDRQTEEDTEPWPELTPLPVATAPAPSLPPALIPEPLRPWLVETAQRNCVALEMVAASAIVAAGAVIGRSFGIRPGRYDDFVAVPNLWGAVVNRPGTVKTTTMIDEGMRPLGLLVAKARTQSEDESEKWAVERSALDAELAAIKKEMDGAARDKQPLDALKAQMAAKR
jgi:hypothetical protein